MTKTIVASLISGPADVAAYLRTVQAQRLLAAMNRQLVLDMDDTLISNQVLFNEATEKLVALYLKLDGQARSYDELYALHTRIDADLIPGLGYTPLRWRTSANQAGSVIAGRTLTDGEAADIAVAAEHAMGVGEVLPGVWDALKALQSAEVPMVLKTKGDLDKQNEKLAAHGFAAVFGSDIHIVDRKDTDSFKAISEQYGFTNPVSIGDSPKSDIVPAREAGYHAIHIDRGAIAWSTEKTDLGDASVVSMPHAIATLIEG